MKNQMKTTMLLSGLLTLSLTAAPARKKPPVRVPAPEPIPAVAAAPPSKPALEPKLHMASPFYLPYTGEFQGSIRAAMQTTRARSDVPAQTFLGMAWPESSADARGATYSGSVSLRYGIFDRFGVGVGTDYYTFLNPTTERRGALTGTEPKTAQPEGFTGPEFSVYGRLAGTRPGQIYIDAQLALRPGFGSSPTNKLGLGRLAVTGTLAAGMNIRFLTFGLGGSVYIAPSTSVTSGSSSYTTTTSAPDMILASGLGIVQAEWQYWYLRGSFGYARFLDANNMRDPVNKNAFLTFGAGAGVKFTEGTLLDFHWSYTPVVKSEEFSTGYALSLRQTNTVGPNMYYGLGFSFKLGGASESEKETQNAANTKPVAAEPENPNRFRGWHLAALGSFGLSNPNESLSKSPRGMTGEKHTAFEGMALVTYYWNNYGGISLGSGYAVRNLSFANQVARINFPARFFDLRAGYRLQLNVFMAELGLLYATPLGESQAEFNLTPGQTSPGKLGEANSRAFAAVYTLIGINCPFTEHIFGLFLLKIDFGLTGAVSGDWPIFHTSGSTEKLNLIPFNLGGSMGLAYKL